jgi:hypothetical protein
MLVLAFGYPTQANRGLEWGTVSFLIPTQAKRRLEWGTVNIIGQSGAASGFGHAGDSGGGCGCGIGCGAGAGFGGLAQAIAKMFGGNFLALPVHAGGLAVVDLHAIHADVALPCWVAVCVPLARIAGDDTWEGDEAATILRPALQDGKIEDAEIFAQDDFLAGRVFG